jgi:hypothetical protein
MTSLSKVYEGGGQTAVGHRRRVLAMVLFAVGVTMGAAAILLTTTGLRSWVGLDVVGARETAGLLAGLGLPAAMVGIFAALPASDETRAAATIGASIAVFGVFLFLYAYPSQWLANDPALAIATVAIYTLGVLVTFWCLFVAVATFNRRNAPGGTARVEITDEGKVRLVSRSPEPGPSAGSDAPAAPGLGGIGMVGSDPDGDIATQTNADSDSSAVETAEPSAGVGPETGTDRPGSVESGGSNDNDPESGSQQTRERQSRSRSESESGSRQTRERQSHSRPESEPTSDGGQSVPRERGAEVISDTGDSQPDAYCGNCAYFEYVEVAGDLDPYCGYHQEFMEDLDACDEWTANTTDR